MEIEMSEQRKNNYPWLGSKSLRITPFPEDFKSSPTDFWSRDVIPSVYKLLSQADRFRLRSSRELLLRMSSRTNLTEIPALPPNERQEFNTRIMNHASETYGIRPQSPEELHSVFSEAMDGVRAVIDVFDNPVSGILRQFRSSISMLNEVAMVSSPAELVCIMTNEANSKRMRFEAMRSLVLLDTGLRVISRQRNLDYSMHMAMDFLNKLLSPDNNGLNGATTPYTVISKHSHADFGCLQVEEIDSCNDISADEYTKRHEFRMRRINWNGREIEFMFDQRSKSLESMILKLIRKDTLNPGGIDDLLGLKFVFKKKEDIYEFMNALSSHAVAQGGFLAISDFEDTIQNGNRFSAKNSGSSSQFETVKFHANLNGALIEFQCYTIPAYLDSVYKKGVGVSEYHVTRLFDSGTVAALYPSDIYGGNASHMRQVAIHQRHESTRLGALTINPEDPINGLVERYTLEDLRADLPHIAKQISGDNFLPAQVVAVDAESRFPAMELASLLDVRRIASPDMNSDYINYELPTLIVDTVACTGRTVRHESEKYQNCRIAVLRLKESSRCNPTLHEEIYTTKTRIPENVWLYFAWN